MGDLRPNQTSQYESVQDFAHKLRAPLRVLREYVGLVSAGRAGSVATGQREFLEAATDRADELEMLIDDALDTGRLEAGLLSVWRRKVSLDEVVERVRQALERTRLNGPVEVLSDEEAPHVYCDPEQIARAWTHLANVCLRFASQGRSIRLWVARDERPGEVQAGVAVDTADHNRNKRKGLFQPAGGESARDAIPIEAVDRELGIARELIEVNLGQLEINTSSKGHTAFSFTLPEWDPHELAACFLERTRERAGGCSCVTLVSANLVGGSGPGWIDDADRFLQKMVRADDFVLRAETTKWLMILRCPLGDAHKVLERLRDTWGQIARPRRAGEACSFRFAVLGSWDGATVHDRLVARFRAELTLPDPESQSPSVLVVDEDPASLDGLGDRLNAAGYEVLTAANSSEGVESAIRHRPDAILLDNYLSGTDGLAAMDELFQNADTQHIPVIMLSTSVRDQQRALEQGARFFLQKPCDAGDVVAALDRVMAEVGGQPVC